MPCYGNYNDGKMPFTKKVVNKNLKLVRTPLNNLLRGF